VLNNLVSTAEFMQCRVDCGRIPKNYQLIGLRKKRSWIPLKQFYGIRLQSSWMKLDGIYEHLTHDDDVIFIEENMRPYW